MLNLLSHLMRDLPGLCCNERHNGSWAAWVEHTKAFPTLHCQSIDIAIEKVYVSNVQDAIQGTDCVKNLWEPAFSFPKIQQ